MQSVHKLKTKQFCMFSKGVQKCKKLAFTVLESLAWSSFPFIFVISWKYQYAGNQTMEGV